MKFEGPTPETETRQVSVSFAAFIVVMAFVLFGIAMAMGTITSLRTPNAPQRQPETTAPEEGFESPPAPLPAVTQPDPTAVIEPDPADPAENESAAAPEAEQPAPPPAPAAAPPVVAAATPQAPRSAAGAPPADTHDASFPTHHVAKPAAPTAAPPAPSY